MFPRQPRKAARGGGLSHALEWALTSAIGKRMALGGTRVPHQSAIAGILPFHVLSRIESNTCGRSDVATLVRRREREWPLYRRAREKEPENDQASNDERDDPSGTHAS